MTLKRNFFIIEQGNKIRKFKKGPYLASNLATELKQETH